MLSPSRRGEEPRRGFRTQRRRQAGGRVGRGRLVGVCEGGAGWGGAGRGGTGRRPAVVGQSVASLPHRSFPDWSGRAVQDHALAMLPRSIWEDPAPRPADLPRSIWEGPSRATLPRSIWEAENFNPSASFPDRVSLCGYVYYFIIFFRICA